MKTCSPAAISAGVRAEMPLAEAAALLEARRFREVCLVEHDPQADRAALRALAAWCGRFSPRVGLEPGLHPETLYFDVTGCGPVFHGEAAFLRQVLRELTGCGRLARAGLADSIGAAWAVAHAAPLAMACETAQPVGMVSGDLPPAAFLIPAGKTRAALGALPVAALRLPPASVATLAELGVHRIEELLNLPRSELPSRLGVAVLERWDQALGSRAELFEPVRPLAPPQAEWNGEHPLTDGQALERLLADLVESVVDQARRLGQGVLRLAFRFQTTEQVQTDEQAAPRWTLEFVRPCLALPHILSVLRLRLERLTWAAPPTAAWVRATQMAPCEWRQTALPGDGETTVPPREMAGLLDRLTSRLGRHAVLTVQLCADPAPERAQRFQLAVGVPAAADAPGPVVAAGAGAVGRRPLRLMTSPCRARATLAGPQEIPTCIWWENHVHAVRRAWGPERIESGWWRAASVCRDYYRLELHTGQRLWVFRHLETQEWFIHGRFD